MHYELDCLMYGDYRTVSQGFWGVVRMMRLGQYSQYWNEERQEAVGGPKWLYDDFIVRMIDMPAASLLSLPKLRSSEADIVYAGLEDVNTQVFAVAAKNKPPMRLLPRYPNNEDLIFTIAEHDTVDIPRPPLTAEGRYNINGVIPVKGDHGRVEVFYAIAARLHGES